MKYFWVIAELGVFDLGNYPRPEAEPVTPKPFTYLLVTRRGTVAPADLESVTGTCGVVGIQAGGGQSWPSWFDQMSAVVQVRIK
jgi:hypothetical protein